MQVREGAVISTLDKNRSKHIRALFDTGAKFTYVSENIGKELGFTPYKEAKDVQLAVKGMKGKIIGEASFIFTIDKYEMPLPIQTYVIEDLMEETIVGTNFMEGFEVELDLKEGKVKLKRYPPEVRLI